MIHVCVFLSEVVIFHVLYSIKSFQVYPEKANLHFNIEKKVERNLDLGNFL